MSKRRKSIEWTQKCVNLGCEKTHRVMDCRDTTEEDKRRLLKDHFDGRNNPKAASIKRGALSDGG